ncbi:MULTISPECIES: YetF domain-containing protein [unclassified Streptomyces]|uniref:YetF domain-containing protein n=1 Tax=unclassified Streptomyces TaxID=2593676 RepID=UPI0009399DCB|nr:YetF domain-containing protein [Streptomyces sp. TSRI0281]OKI37457.1 hypothetical protein A6A29_40820 [Streptomyces sp. TSRI0281]
MIHLDHMALGISDIDSGVRGLTEQTVPVTLVRDGTWLPKAISRNRLRRSDLEVTVRSQDGDGGAEASEVTLQPSGTLLVTLRKSDQAADKNDVVALSAELTALRTELDMLRREMTARP